jgi:glycosyltransferase involved in cell wall biosynthesis
MKLIVQVPCYNEEETLAATVAGIPRQIPGIDRVEILIVDDGSSDETLRVARAAGVDYVVRHRRNRGLAAAFRTGLDAALRLGADIVVNTDADNQYEGRDIPKLIRPLVEGRADLVVGDRNPSELTHFSPTKRLLQRMGSSLVRRLSGVNVSDAVSGFRALTREAGMRINVVSDFSYTIETLIQAGRSRMAVESVPIRARETSRESRLFTSIPKFLERSLGTMLRVYTMYHPLRVFLVIGLSLATLGSIPIVRFVWYYFQGEGAGKVQSLLLGGVLVILGFVAGLVGVVADLIAFNRRLIEECLVRVRQLESSGEMSSWRSGAIETRVDSLPGGAAAEAGNEPRPVGAGGSAARDGSPPA